jgi:hypothetical protein
VMPQIVRTHANGWAAVIGGEVYRGPCYPDIIGTYFFADYQANQVSIATRSGATVTATDLPPLGSWPEGIASIHGDARGELYLTTAHGVASLNGVVYHIEAAP